MAYSVNWNTKVVLIPQADLTFVSANPNIYQLSVVEFWQSIHGIQDGEGMPYPSIMQSNAPTAFGPRGVEIINGYTIEFEDGPYTVQLIDANSDIQANAVQNQVSIQDRTLNGQGLTVAERAKLDELWRIMGLDAANPMTVTPTSRVAGGINQAISGDGEDTTTVSRQ